MEFLVKIGQVGWGFEQPALVEGVTAWQGGWN